MNLGPITDIYGLIRNIIARNEQAAGQVGLISGGGSGHEPAHAARTRRTDQIVAQQRGERQGHG